MISDPQCSTLPHRLNGTNLYLIGMMGSGKTTTGQELAAALGYRFMDTDRLIEQVAGQSVSEIFAQAGEATFRQLETQVLAEVSCYHHLVVATGGGIILEPMNWSYLHHGLVIWLKVSIPNLVNRLAGDTTRPLLAHAALAEKLTTLAQARNEFYAQADLTLTIADNLRPRQVSQAILTALPKILRDDI
ncbi:shikimate kinase [Thermosynechococcaceae cyanobacterium BACA0444]|uniref:Shikimate kinase n=1 Tax=Pseudocalidococcus azoricus BACA0444 TaxID=2918990 RepID=A0AAE4FPW8_9CYAN|nr:shikimate kinase [Pseudocalidococcus azoricus]MDS3859569.1 shikimate kinase [Pseudocalidococcus azoricus BACA0444]